MKILIRGAVMVGTAALVACASPPLGLDPGPALITGTWTVHPEKTLEAAFEQHQTFQTLPVERKDDLIRSFPVFLQITFTESGMWKGVFRQKDKEERGEGRCRILFRSASEVRVAVEEDAKPPREILLEVKGPLLVLRFADDAKALFVLQKTEISPPAPSREINSLLTRKFRWQ